MPRPLRFIPQPGSFVEVTTRTFQSHLLLSPGPLLNEIIPWRPRPQPDSQR
jgi:hypothetical protein